MPNSVLVVDDEEGIRQTLSGVLEDEGLSVETAATGEECLRAFERRVFGCVLLDVWLPGMDGIETLGRLKAAYPETAVIMISGHGSIETAVRATQVRRARLHRKASADRAHCPGHSQCAEAEAT